MQDPLLCLAHVPQPTIPAMLQQHHHRSQGRLHSSRAMLRVCALHSSSLPSSTFSTCHTSSTSSTTTPSSPLPLALWGVRRCLTTHQLCQLAQPWDRLKTGSSMVSHSKSHRRVLPSLEVVAEAEEEVVPRAVQRAIITIVTNIGQGSAIVYYW